MADSEKVTEELQLLRDFLMSEERKAFKGNNNSTVNVLMHYRNIVIEAIALLKEQEAVKPKLDVDSMVCGKCGHPLIHQERLGDAILFEERHNYCPQCGRQVKWNESD